MKLKAPTPILYILVSNHFDLTWRRCWDRRFTFGGYTYVSYADIEEYCILDNLDLARKHPGYKFEIECPAVARKFLERHPERMGELQRLVREKRLAVSGTGDNIVDSNMIHGEGLIRNFLTGLLWLENTLGQKTRLGVRNDAFGNSAQLPQILRGCEMAWVTGLTYSHPTRAYWRGLDGSVVLHRDVPCVAFGGGWYKYPPCPSCRGTGCSKCRGRGIHLTRLSGHPPEVNDGTLRRAGAGLAIIAPEELLPNPDLLNWARALRKKYDVRFAIHEDVMPHIQPLLDGVDDPSPGDVHPAAELNPNSTGGYVTRIKTKQNCRRQEYALLAAESLCSFAALGGRPYPRKALLEIWRKLLFTQFHDAVTGTHVDAAYSELEDVWAAIDGETSRVSMRAIAALSRPKRGLVSVVNCFGDAATQVVTATISARSLRLPAAGSDGKRAKVIAARKAPGGRISVDFLVENVPPFSVRTYRIPSPPANPHATPLRKPIIESQHFRIEADHNGLLSVRDKRLGAAILKADEYRPGELILEHDEGSPWATLHPDQRRTPLARHTRLVAAEKSRAFQRLIFETVSPEPLGLAGEAVRARTAVTLFHGIDRVEFKTHVSWNAFNHRLRVAMPVPARGRHIYGIPYGMLERRPYQPDLSRNGADGDWPALNWAGVEGTRLSVALLNKGLPSHRMEKGKTRGELILLSLLRSPTIPSALDEPYYSMTDWNGMRDAGDHDFEYAVVSYGGKFAASDVVRDAEAYNAGLLAVEGDVRLPDCPRLVSENVHLSSIKWAEKGRALIIRLCEFRGRGGEARVSLPSSVRRAQKVNMLERRGTSLQIRRRRVVLSLRPWEIATLRLDL